MFVHCKLCTLYQYFCEEVQLITLNVMHDNVLFFHPVNKQMNIQISLIARHMNHDNGLCSRLMNINKSAILQSVSERVSLHSFVPTKYI